MLAQRLLKAPNWRMTARNYLLMQCYGLDRWWKRQMLSNSWYYGVVYWFLRVPWTEWACYSGSIKHPAFSNRIVDKSESASSRNDTLLSPVLTGATLFQGFSAVCHQSLGGTLNLLRGCIQISRLTRVLLCRTEAAFSWSIGWHWFDPRQNREDIKHTAAPEAGHRASQILCMAQCRLREKNTDIKMTKQNFTA